MADATLRQYLGQQIMNITSGHPTEEALGAQADALATSIGGICFLSRMTRTEAMQVLRDLTINMQRHISDNWGQIARGDN
jgi:hypothetical protein